MKQTALKLGVELSVFQSNSESAIIERVRSCLSSGYKGLVINPTPPLDLTSMQSETPYSSALPFVEVHLTNVHSGRNSGEKGFHLSDIARGVVVDFRSKSYELGLLGLVHSLDKADDEVLK
ncbi:MAG: type II 3-dehydroquinate dehydratase [Cyanobacteriota/Melainabacteria group bacterium]